MKILLHLRSKELRNGRENPKNYPFREELYELLKGHEIIEIQKPIPLEDSIRYIKEADAIICIDSYLQHLCWYVGKQAIVLWGQSDPEIFGHKENLNLLKNKKYLREKQFWLWEQTLYNEDVFVSPKEIINCLSPK
jgi:ADP-heptose:LPS heptosyltransferase